MRRPSRMAITSAPVSPVVFGPRYSPGTATSRSISRTTRPFSLSNDATLPPLSAVLEHSIKDYHIYDRSQGLEPLTGPNKHLLNQFCRSALLSPPAWSVARRVVRCAQF